MRHPCSSIHRPALLWPLSLSFEFHTKHAYLHFCRKAERELELVAQDNERLFRQVGRPNNVPADF